MVSADGSFTESKGRVVILAETNQGVFNGQSTWPNPSAVRVVYSDSSTSYGGYCVEHGSHIANGQWT